MMQSYRPSDDLTGEDWKRARRRVLYRKVVCAITHCSVDMRPFAEVQDFLQLNEERYRGLQEIPIENIRGSVGRFEDFTATFMPRKEHMRERWQRVDQLLRDGDIPPIEVYQVDHSYFVVDGNHRVSAARHHGLDTIMAHVTEFESPFAETSKDAPEQQFIQAEKASFLEKVGQENAENAAEITFTCPACYRDVANQVETYRQGMEIVADEPVSFRRAFASWHDEVYTAAVNSIREDGLLELFPDRTEGDIFIWAWRNSHALESEDLDLHEDVGSESPARR